MRLSRVQQLVPVAAVEALDEGVLDRLAGIDVISGDTAFRRPGAAWHSKSARNAVVGHSEDAEPPAIDHLVVHEVERLALVPVARLYCRLPGDGRRLPGILALRLRPHGS